MSSYGERKSRFMKWVSKLFNNGATPTSRRVANTGGGQHPHDQNRAPVKSLVFIFLFYHS